MKKVKKKNTTSKKNLGGRPATGYKILGVNERVQKLDPNDDPRVEFHPEQREDSEKILPVLYDEASKHKYPPPRKDPYFRKMWMQFIDSVMNRSNFNPAHLSTLEILCDLYVEYEQLQAFVRKRGRSYKSMSRVGMVWKIYPEVQRMSAVQSQIKDYTKMLGLILTREKGSDGGREKENWE